MRLIGSAASVHHDHASRLTRCDDEICTSHSSKKRTALLLESVLITLSPAILADLSLVAAAGALHTLRHVRIHQNGKFRPQTAA